MEDKKRKVVYEDEEKAPLILDQDEWALEWITIRRLHAIAEAFDDDASGYITIAEVNNFTTSRPLEWRQVFPYEGPARRDVGADLFSSSLPQWIAYWSVGALFSVYFGYAALLVRM